jgi:hypothetical protein
MDGLAILVLIALVSAVILKIGMYFWGNLGGIVLAIAIIVLMLVATGDSEERYTKHDFGEETVCEQVNVTIFVPETTCFVNYNAYGYPSGHVCYPGNSEAVITRTVCRRTLRKNTATAPIPRVRRMPTVTTGE